MRCQLPRPNILRPAKCACVSVCVPVCARGRCVCVCESMCMWKCACVRVGGGVRAFLRIVLACLCVGGYERVCARARAGCEYVCEYASVGNAPVCVCACLQVRKLWRDRNQELKERRGRGKGGDAQMALRRNNGVSFAPWGAFHMQPEMPQLFPDGTQYRGKHSAACFWIDTLRGKRKKKYADKFFKRGGRYGFFVY